MNKKELTQWKHLCILVKPYIKKLILLILVMIFASGLNILIPLLQQNIIDLGIVKKDINIVVQLFVQLVIIYLALTGINILQNYLQSSISINICKDLELAVFEHALKLKVGIIKEKGLYKIVKDVDNYIQSIADLTGGQTTQILIEIFKFFGIFIALLALSWKVTLYLLLLIPIRLLVTHYTSKLVKRNSEKSFCVQKEMHRWEENIYNSFIELKLWNLVKKKVEEYSEMLKERNYCVMQQSIFTGLDSSLGSCIQQIIINSIYVLGGYFIIDDKITLGTLITFVTYSAYILQPISLVSYLKMIISKVAPEFEEYKKFLLLEEEKDDSSNLFPEGDIYISFEDVSFKYDDKSIFSNICFTLKKGDIVAITGENGAGKSTLINLILRLYEPTSGEILLNGININQISLEDYRDKISVVPQVTNLFAGSIEENINILGAYVNGFDENETKLFSFINNLENGVQSQVGSQSSLLSGGEKQKISLLRALRKEAKILILDEPTSNYDCKSEEDFKKLLMSIQYDIIILVTHNSALLSLANKEIHLTNGILKCKEKRR